VVDPDVDVLQDAAGDPRGPRLGLGDDDRDVVELAAPRQLDRGSGRVGRALDDALRECLDRGERHLRLALVVVGSGDGLQLAVPDVVEEPVRPRDDDVALPQPDAREVVGLQGLHRVAVLRA